MNLNRFNTTPQSHPHMYFNGEMYIGKHRPLCPGQKVTTKVAAEMLAVCAVNLGWQIGEIALAIAAVIRRRTGIEVCRLEDEYVHGVGAAAMACEISRRIVAYLGQGNLLNAYNDAVCSEISDVRYRQAGEVCRSGKDVFAKIFGIEGGRIYSEYAAVHSDVYAQCCLKINQIVSSMLVRISDLPEGASTGPADRSANRPRIIRCPNCGKNVSTESATCWCCEFPIPK